MLDVVLVDVVDVDDDVADDAAINAALNQASDDVVLLIVDDDEADVVGAPNVKLGNELDAVVDVEVVVVLVVAGVNVKPLKSIAIGDDDVAAVVVDEELDAVVVVVASVAIAFVVVLLDIVAGVTVVVDGRCERACGRRRRRLRQ